MGRTVYSQAFSNRLRTELDRRDWGVRTLAREMSSRRGTTVEAERRRLNKYLAADHVPALETRGAIEDALGIERGSLNPADEDDEEAARVIQIERGLSILDDLHAALMAAKSGVAHRAKVEA